MAKGGRGGSEGEKEKAGKGAVDKGRGGDLELNYLNYFLDLHNLNDLNNSNNLNQII